MQVRVAVWRTLCHMRRRIVAGIASLLGLEDTTACVSWSYLIFDSICPDERPYLLVSVPGRSQHVFRTRQRRTGMLLRGKQNRPL